MNILPGSLPLCLAAALALAGCGATMTVAPPTLTSATALNNGKRIPTTTFTVQDRVIQLVDFSWPDPREDGGTNNCRWKWFRGTTLLSETPVKHLEFQTTPWAVRSARSAATLGTGNFTVETIVDGNVVATSAFTTTG